MRFFLRLYLRTLGYAEISVMLASLPQEIVRLILEELSIREILVCAQVSLGSDL